MKRKEHLFQFTGGEIANAALAEEKYHRERLEWWNGEYEKAVLEAKQSTVEVTEYDVTGGKRATVTVSSKATERIGECATKRSNHRIAADEFAIESAAYGTQLSRVYELDTEDVIHFRLAGGARPL